jgi:TolB protein
LGLTKYPHNNIYLYWGGQIMVFKKINIRLILIIGTTTILNGCGTVDPPLPIIDTTRDEAPAWSPDSNYIAFNHFDPYVDEHTNPYGLYILNLETGERTLVIEGPAFNPDWSPDGEWIAFNSGDIFRIRPDGSDLQQIPHDGNAYFPSWHPEGKRIAYDATQHPENLLGIWFIDCDGRNPSHVGLGRHPDWSPNGTNIVYEGPSSSSNSESQIWRADSSGIDKEQLTTNNFVINRSPSWSPDGEWIAWHTNNGIWVMRSDGSDQWHLTEGETPSWSPDSQRIVFSKSSPNNEKVVLWIINRDGSGLKQITF